MASSDGRASCARSGGVDPRKTTMTQPFRRIQLAAIFIATLYQLRTERFPEDFFSRHRDRHCRDKSVHRSWIEMGAREVLQLGDGFQGTAGRAVRTRARHCIERIGNVHDARSERNVRAPQAKWIAVAIWSLVVQLDDGNVWGKKG